MESSLQRRRHAAPLALFALLFLLGAWFQPLVEYDNTTVRHLQVAAIVNDGTLHIDAYRHLTVDTSTGNGHTYPNKGIGTALVAVPVYWVLRTWTPLNRYPALNPVEKWLLRALTTTTAYAAIGVLLYLLACRWGAPPRHALATALAWGLGTIGWQHAIQLSGHVLTAFWIFLAFFLLERTVSRPADAAKPWAGWAALLGAGAAAGLATLTEYLAGFLAVALTIYLLAHRPSWRQWLPFAIGAGACAGLLMAYNIHCFGGPFRLSYASLADEGFRASTAQGLMGIGWPRPTVLAALLLSPARGLLTISPVLVLGLAGLVWLAHHGRRREAALMAGASGLLLLLNAGYFGWHGGWAYGPRYLVPILPFLCLPIAFVWRWCTGHVLLLLLAAVEVAASVAGMAYPPETVANPLIEIVLPLARSDYRSVTLGDLLGMSGIWIWLTPAIVGGVLFAGSWMATPPIPKPMLPTALRSHWLPCGWATIVVALLVIIRTEPPQEVHANRAMLFQHAYYTLGDPGFAALAARETQLAAMPALTPDRAPPR